MDHPTSFDSTPPPEVQARLDAMEELVRELDPSREWADLRIENATLRARIVELERALRRAYARYE